MQIQYVLRFLKLLIYIDLDFKPQLANTQAQY